MKKVTLECFICGNGAPDVPGEANYTTAFYYCPECRVKYPHTVSVDLGATLHTKNIRRSGVFVERDLSK